VYDNVLIRYGEIGLKGNNRNFFEETLIANIRKALKGIETAGVYKSGGRILIRADKNKERIINRLTGVFGIVSMSPAIQLENGMEYFLEKCKQIIDNTTGVKSFRVDCRRADKNFPITSPEVSRILGAQILEAYPDLRVDLHNPDLNLNLEIRVGQSLIYARTVPGPGGLPVGVSSKGLLLLSGGLDSPVAGWTAMKRGIKLQAIHFYSFPYTGERSKKKVIDLASKIAVFNQGQMRLFVINFTPIQDCIKQNCPEKLRVTIMRRMMLRIAEKIAQKEGNKVLITGESVGQVASQTIESMSVISQAASILQLRPLAGWDKTEIIEKARAIDTYDISILPFEDCCSLFLPRHPATKPDLAQVLRAEEGEDWEYLITEATNGAELIEILSPELH
jgi:thiamine biosynthesis protein ThiI